MGRKIKALLLSFGRLHPFAKQVMWGCFQFNLVMYGFAAAYYVMAPYTNDYFDTLNYAKGLSEMAPVVLLVGLIVGLVSDLALRKSDEVEDKSDHKDHHT